MTDFLVGDVVDCGLYKGEVVRVIQTEEGRCLLKVSVNKTFNDYFYPHEVTLLGDGEKPVSMKESRLLQVIGAHNGLQKLRLKNQLLSEEEQWKLKGMVEIEHLVKDFYDGKYNFHQRK